MSFQMSVEVERKFLCNADTLKTLEEIGGTCLICLPHIYAWVNLEVRHLTDAVIRSNFQMVTEGIHLMTLIAVICTVTVVTLTICLLLIMKFNYLYQPR